MSAALAMLAGCSLPQTPEPRQDPRPDVVLILIDTFRPDHLGVNGYERRTAPFLEDLMSRSAVFSRVWSTSSWTAPATGSVFTSLYPTRHGVVTGFLAHRKRAQQAEQENGQKITLNRLPRAMETLPELLRTAGYATYGIATNINVGSEIGFDRGFDRFDRNARVAAKVADQLAGWRNQILGARPYFLYLHFNDPHVPYRPREPWYQDQDEELPRTVSAYDSEISYLDSVLEGLYEDFGWDRNTLLVVVSDHGEEFGERGRVGHRFSLFDELMRVLLVISGENLGIPAKTIDLTASLVDVLPTVLDLVGEPVPEGRDGSSLAPFLRSDPAVPTAEIARRTVFAHRFKPRGSQHLWAAVRGPWKLIEGPGGSKLYHLDKDPGERRDRFRRQPRIAARLEQELDRFRAAGFHRAEDTTEVELDRETLEELKTLGYVE